MTIRLGVDIGGTGIKAAPVDVDQGVLVLPRRCQATPRPATTRAVAAAVVELTSTIDAEGPVGFGYLGVDRGLRTATPVAAAALGNNAGIGAAALAGSEAV